jgi:hypothetical protein
VRPVERTRFAVVDLHHLGRWLSDRGDWMTPDVDVLLEVMAALNIPPSSILTTDGLMNSSAISTDI